MNQLIFIGDGHRARVDGSILMLLTARTTLKRTTTITLFQTNQPHLSNWHSPNTKCAISSYLESELRLVEDIIDLSQQ